MKIEGIVFDLDGVICSTDEYHYLAWKALADDIGVYFDRKINDRMRGVSRMQSLEILLERSSVVYSEQQKLALADRKNELYRQSLAKMTPGDLPRAVGETLDELRRRGYLLAIGSSSKNASCILERIGLKGYFDAVSDGNGLRRSKPDPEVFLRAADMLKLVPAACLVVEDAVPGTEAGFAAGMKVACVGNAAEHGAGDFNLSKFSELSELLKRNPDAEPMGDNGNFKASSERRRHL